MLGVLFGILKVIGIIIAVILCVLLLLILLVLFVPFRYSVIGEYKDKKYISCKVAWLLNLIGIYVTFDGDLNFKIRILFFNIGNKTNNKAKTKKNSSSRQGEKAIQTEQIEKPEQKKEIKPAPIDNVVSEDFYEEPDIPKIEEKSKKETEEKINVFESIKNTFGNIKNKTISIEEVVSEKYNKIQGFINNQEYKDLVAFLLEQLKLLFKKILPKKYRVNVTFGFDDPSTTGKILGMYYSFYGFTGFEINACPDFDKQILEADGYVKGYIRLISLVIIALRIYTNKLFKKHILKRIKNK